MKLKVNDKEMETEAATLARLCEELNLPTTGIAVAVNQRMITRSQWEEHTLAEGDKIVVIKAVCGG